MGVDPGERMADYNIQLPVFEGPLDLLLYLIKKEEVDIYEVNLTKIATQFLEYLERMRQLDLDIAGDFLVMAATLLYIKSRELLPVDQQTLPDGEEEDESLDPRWELIRQLVEYKKFKEKAGQFQAWEIRQESVYPRQPGPLDWVGQSEFVKPRVTLLDLLNAVNVILKRHAARDEMGEILAERWNVSEKIEWLLKKFGEQPRLKFSELFAGAASRLEVVVTFLALLELVRLRQLAITQTEPYQEIHITRASPEAGLATTPPDQLAGLGDAVEPAL